METKIKKPSLFIFFVGSSTGVIIAHIISGNENINISISHLFTHWIGGLVMYYNFIHSNGRN